MTRKRRHNERPRAPSDTRKSANGNAGAPPGVASRPTQAATPRPSQAGYKSAAPMTNEAPARKKRRRRRPQGPEARPAEKRTVGAQPLRSTRPLEADIHPVEEDVEPMAESVRFVPPSSSPEPSVRHETLEFSALDDTELDDLSDIGLERRGDVFEGDGSLDDDEEEEEESTPTVRRPRASEEPELVAAQIRELEAHLDRMIDQASTHVLPEEDDGDDEWRNGPRGASDDGEPAPAPSTVVSLGPTSARSLPADTEPTVFDTARELLSTDFYLRKWGRLGMRNRSEEIDDFGYDPVYDAKVRPVFDFLYDKYFRVETSGAGNIPAEGRCLLVANHSGTLPYDGAMIKTAVKREHPQHRDVRWLAEDFIFHFPFLGSFTNRIGAVRACQENAERLLRQEALVAVFPEGIKGIGKLYKDRYRLQRFGRGGFIKLCLRTNTPIVPCIVLGAEEANPMLLRVETFARVLGLPYIPVTPTFPLFGAAGLAPAPTKWKIIFGDLLDVASYGPEAADDELLVGRLAERVRKTIQEMLDRALAERKSVFFG